MKSSLLVCVLAISAMGQTAAIKTVDVTPVAGESWLNHLHRNFDETNMGKTGQLGPPSLLESEDAGWDQPLSNVSTKQTVTLRGADLYRLNCWGCHGESGLGAPPEINSVINPTRATSTQLILERMKNVGMDMSRSDAAQLANQSQAALLQRLHQGGTDMPPFPHLSEPEVRAIIGYLKQMAGVPGAENQQTTVEESRIRVGEHIVKSTCHICHSAAGSNPNAEQLFDGAIPPLSTLTARTSLSGFERKVRSGAPITMGTPPSPFRGRMPVFYYLNKDEAADAYLYLKLYPPERTAPEPLMAATEQKRGDGKIVPVGFHIAPASIIPPSEGRDLFVIAFPIFAGLLLAGGSWFTLWEIRRLTASSPSRSVFVIGHLGIAEHLPTPVSSTSRPSGWLSPSHAPSTDTAAQVANLDESVFHDEDFYTFERSWLERWLERKDEAA